MRGHAIAVTDPVLHTQTVTKGGATVRLRDASGRRYWDPNVVPGSE